MLRQVHIGATIVALLIWGNPGIAAAQAPYGSPGRFEERSERKGKKVDDKTLASWAADLGDPKPGVRYAAVKSLGSSGDPRAVSHLVEAVLDHDARIAARAVDYLGRLRALDASEFLTERLFVKKTSDPLRLAILVALGRIGDAGSSERILEFISITPSHDLRAAAYFSLGETGDATIADDLRRIAEREEDPKLKSVARETLAKISGRRYEPTPVPENRFLRGLEP